MAFEATDILQLVLLLTWMVFDATPSNQKHPIHSLVITSRAIFVEIFSAVNLHFAPGLFETIQSATPPTMAYFKSLPTNTKSRWAVYLLSLEKLDCRPRIYIGSGTSSLFGVSARFAEYSRDIHAVAFPQYVKESLEEGYVIVHQGLLCWTPLPSAALQRRTRLLFVAIEAAFAYVFWAMKATKGDYGMSWVCPWGRENLEYDGLCSHPCLTEPVTGDFNLSPEDLEAQATELKRRRSELQTVINTNYVSRQIETNHDVYRARKSTNQANYVKNNRDKARESHNRSLARAVANKKYYCEVCDLACRKKCELTKHLQSQRHLSKAAIARQHQKALAARQSSSTLG